MEWSIQNVFTALKSNMSKGTLVPNAAVPGFPGAINKLSQ